MAHPRTTEKTEEPMLSTPEYPPGRGLSLVIPAYNEEAGLQAVLEESIGVLDKLDIDYEIVVVDDCSSDRTLEIAKSVGVIVHRNFQNGGYGYSLMRGIRLAKYPTVAIIDADGSYQMSEFPKLYEEYQRGAAMVVGHRQGRHYVGSIRMKLLRWLFRSLAQFIVGRPVPDVNSGMRIFEREAVLPLFPHLSYGFSFTTSITLLFMMRALPVSYIPVKFLKRKGSSKVRYFRDSLRALQIITSITARLNPIKLFMLGAVANLVVVLPIVAVLAPGGDFRALLLTVIETSVLLVGFGVIVEALIDKSPFDKRSTRDDHPLL